MPLFNIGVTPEPRTEELPAPPPPKPTRKRKPKDGPRSPELDKEASSQPES